MALTRATLDVVAGQVLAAGGHGAQEPGGGDRHLHRLRGWLEGLSRGNKGCVSANGCAAVSGANVAPQPELSELEDAQSGGRRPEDHLQRRNRG